MDNSSAERQGRAAEQPRQRKRHSSVYERVMGNPQSREAYFNTTRGMLTGNPEQGETKSVRNALNDGAVAHLFTPDATLPQPVFYSAKTVSVGAIEIATVTGCQIKISD